MADSNSEIQRLLEIIPFGKENAMHAEDIAVSMGYPVGGNQVETRQLIRSAIQQGNIILSTPKDGYWRSKTKQEVEDYIDSLQNRAAEIITRSTEIKNAWNRVNPDNLIL